MSITIDSKECRRRCGVICFDLVYSGVDHVVDKRFTVGNRSALDDDDVTICCSDLFTNNRPITRKPVQSSSVISAIICLREFQLPSFFMPTTGDSPITVF
jgi:hypothetical protein